eukprot:GFKZ01008649.1.p2 GENE.GFKZ01008649.1~~GFKZ01008649.1.p2  ORF type:complete len:108 (-),score=25.46 GFKZ01008649.1:16-339(-)
MRGSAIEKIGKEVGSEERGGSHADPPENMSLQGELVALSGSNLVYRVSGSGEKKAASKSDENVVKRVLQKKSCLFYMESMQHMRKSILWNEWEGRMGTFELKNAAAE